MKYVILQDSEFKKREYKYEKNIIYCVALIIAIVTLSSCKGDKKVAGHEGKWG